MHRNRVCFHKHKIKHIGYNIFTLMITSKQNSQPICYAYN
ncbi:hypothetical protein NIES4071_23300 [Calothrix sp. NIES-4071]|nr:hypothetical protein NIES4071_23300 [Calothrix sp. NIES-4071]BAZ56655.1 hypothetical protein NIES4105_23250 [Calothrix sp. NIES-4105]